MSLANTGAASSREGINYLANRRLGINSTFKALFLGDPVLIRILYTLILLLAAPLLLFGLYQSKPNKPKFGTRWKEHFGLTPTLTNAQPVIWLHAVSVGESLAAIPVLRALKQGYPDYQIVVTTTTSTGAAQIAKLGDLVSHRYMPIDLPVCINGFIRNIKPSCLLIMETELWPNTLASAKAAGIPVCIVNARLSARSAGRYGKFQWVFNEISRHIDHLFCVAQSDADRFKQLGLTAQQVSVTGSIKNDIQINSSVTEQAQTLRHQLGATRPVWVAASTHKGEDEQVLDAFKAVLKTLPDSLLILVPRHPERFDAMAQLCQDMGFSVQRRSQGFNPTQPCQVYLADSMGEMLLMLAAADATFMGGSLIGDAVGGHNMLEPAALAKPTITGPSYYNFTEIAEQLRQAQGLWVCQNSEQLAVQMTQLLSDQGLAQQVGQAALQVVKQNQGAVAKTVQGLSAYLELSRS
ncbi:lipid IV(A) 3-deoxy-D-manno-octulosonic acid transferase [Motilimonas cestriensis]|uniref:lipid IV(A) 3-deoxy-D-manno-octulosonic acid transferase n=1 Tax=Motilimonas cestriensis TaxID=2742685 RepID=UPI003DA2088F